MDNNETKHSNYRNTESNVNHITLHELTVVQLGNNTANISFINFNEYATQRSRVMKTILNVE